MSRPSFDTQRIYDLVTIERHVHYSFAKQLCVVLKVWLKNYRGIQERRWPSSPGRLHGEDGIVTEEVVVQHMVPRPAATASGELRNVNPQLPPQKC